MQYINLMSAYLLIRAYRCCIMMCTSKVRVPQNMRARLFIKTGPIEPRKPIHHNKLGDISSNMRINDPKECLKDLSFSYGSSFVLVLRQYLSKHGAKHPMTNTCPLLCLLVQYNAAKQVAQLNGTDSSLTRC